MKTIRRLCTVYEGEKAEIILYGRTLPPDLPHKRQHFEALEMLSAVCAHDFRVRNLFLTRDENGKPRLRHDSLFVNLTHCKGLAVCAVGYREVGVDAEAPRMVKDSVLKRICSEEEYRMLSASDSPETDFSALWTLKEAYGKWNGSGIRLSLSELSFSLSEQKLVFAHPDSGNVTFLKLMLKSTEPSPIAVSLCCGKLSRPQIETTADVLISDSE